MVLVHLFLIILFFLIPEVNTQIESYVELTIPTGIRTNEANAEIETQPLTVEMKKRKRWK